VGTVLMRSLFHHPGTRPDFPWHVCARTVGDRVDMKAWFASQAEPSWTDTEAGGSVGLPSGWDQPGAVGFYAGHLPPGRTMELEDLRTAEVRRETDQIAVPIGGDGGISE